MSSFIICTGKSIFPAQPEEMVKYQINMLRHLNDL